MLRSDEIAAFLLAEHSQLTAYVASVTRDFHLAEDILPEVSVRDIAAAAEFDNRKHLINWMRLAGRNRAINMLRTCDNRYEGLSSEVLATLADEWMGPEEVSSIRGAVAQCLERVMPTTTTRRFRIAGVLC